MKYLHLGVALISLLAPCGCSQPKTGQQSQQSNNDWGWGNGQNQNVKVAPVQPQPNYDDWRPLVSCGKFYITAQRNGYLQTITYTEPFGWPVTLRHAGGPNIWLNAGQQTLLEVFQDEHEQYSAYVNHPSGESTIFR